MNRTVPRTDGELDVPDGGRPGSRRWVEELDAGSSGTIDDGAVARAVRRILPAPAELLLQMEQRPHRIAGGVPRLGLAHDVAEDLERERPPVARLHGCADDALDVKRPLAGKAAMVSAPLEDVHAEPVCVGDLHEGDSVSVEAGQRLGPVASGEHVERVHRHADLGPVDELHDARL